MIQTKFYKIIKSIIISSLVIIFPVNISASDFDITLSKTNVKQGETIKIELMSKEFIQKVTVSFDNKYYKAFKKKSSKKAPYHYSLYLGISRYQKIGTTPLKIWIKTNKTQELH